MPPDRRSAIRFIVCLGIVSLFADMTYEGARSVIGPYLKELGASAAQVSIVAGFGEMLAASLRFFSGRVADRSGAYWSMTSFGYALSVLTVPAMALASNWPAAAALVILERTGKALRGPARDVLLSGATGAVGHGWGFGLHAALDQTGAVIGPLLMALAVTQSGQFAPAFLWLAIPAVLTLAALSAARAIDAGRVQSVPTPTRQPLPKVFWRYAASAALLACGFIDFPLIAFHLQKMPLVSSATIPLLYAGAMGLTGLAALLFGRLFDRFGIVVLTGAILISLLALPLALLGGGAAAIAGIACWSIGMGAQDATLRPGIAHVVSMNRRGSAFGAFNALYGVMWFAGSAAMGLMYDRSIPALIAFGMLAQMVAAAMFLALRKPLAEAAAVR